MIHLEKSFCEVKFVIEEGIKKRVYPGAVILIGTREKILFLRAFGREAPSKDAKTITIETVYDLASLTKVTTVLPAIMFLINRGQLALGDPVYIYLKEFSDRKQITIFHLVTHSSGMPPYSTAWRSLRGKVLLDKLLRTKPIFPAGKRFQYSCINFIILKAVIEAITGTLFDRFLRENIFAPLGLECIGFLPDVKRFHVAPTCKREGEFLRGKPDDELAYYLGGVSGNAGCFSNAMDLYRLINGLEGEKLFPKRIFELFTREIVDIGGVKTHLGWRVPDFSGSSGDFLDTYAYGHTGFTGTSIWVDAKSGVRVIFLSNRTRLSRRSTIPLMQSIRRKLHNVVFSEFR